MPEIIDIKLDTRREARVQQEVARPNDPPLEQYVDVYIIRSDSPFDDQLDILQTPGLAGIPIFIGGSVLRSLLPREVDPHARIWEVEAVYDSRVADPNQTQPNTESIDPEIDWDAENVSEALKFDQITGDPVVNAVQEPIELETIRPLPILRVVKTQLTFDPDIILDFVNHTNQDEFYGAPPGTALMEKIRDRSGVYRGYPVRKVTYQIKFNFNRDEEGNLIGWTSRGLHLGNKYLPEPDDVVPDDLVTFLDKTGQPKEVFLNEDGTLSRTPTFISFNKFPETPFAPLVLGPF